MANSPSDRPSVWIDVGGTFTDCLIAEPGSSELRTLKVLSSGATKGIATRAAPDRLHDRRRADEPVGFRVGYDLTILDYTGKSIWSSKVIESEREFLTTADALPPGDGFPYELASGEPAPVFAMRCLFGLPLGGTIPPVDLRLGTTRGTNAVLTRTGAATGLLITQGFEDALHIGDQSRPDLFAIDIAKPEPLFRTSVGVTERIGANGEFVTPIDQTRLRDALERLHADGIESVAIAFLHSWKNPTHELIAERIARSVGFEHVSLSHRVSTVPKFLPRADTAVLDGYLNPILRNYLDRIAAELPGSRVRVMTSSGGLVTAERFTGKESLLSGPAGGVVGVATVAEAAAFPRAIGFDMGGTSTDVSRFAGELHRQSETTKAGVRVAVPMLKIETVAAGGGSVCHFDGVKLRVGPESAGTHPGPACYGRGGPLTVTDLNVHLGRVPETQFPFPLDRGAVEQRLSELLDPVNASAASPLTLTGLASGLLEIANLKMVRAIREITIAEGVNPTDFVLVAFGGAGGQHACSVARALGIREVLIHPNAGILSAYGIGHADVRVIRERTLLAELTAIDAPSYREWVAELTAEATEKLRDSQGTSKSKYTITADLRFVGLDETLIIPGDDFDALERLYRTQYRSLFGIDHPHRGIELVRLRVEGISRGHRSPSASKQHPSSKPQPSTTTVWNRGGDSISVPVYLRADLAPGHTIFGPAIVCEPTSTTVIDQEFRAEVLSEGELLLTNREPQQHLGPTETNTQIEADPIRLEVFHHQFASIAEQMGETLRRTSVSPNVKERLDFSCAIFAADGSLVANAPHIPVHLGAMAETVRETIRLNDAIQPGDVFITNDPFAGGSHLPDVTVLTPVHDTNDDRLLFWTASRAHHAEIGGIVPGSMPPFSKTLADEGVLIRNRRLFDAGTSRLDELQALLTSGDNPSRSPADNVSDVLAQVAANRVGVARLIELADECGRETVFAFMGHVRNASAERVRQALRSRPDGGYRFEDALDDGAPIVVTVTIDDDEATFDFTGSGEVLATNLNANRGIVTAAVMYTLRCLLETDIPLNGGALDPARIILPQGMLNPPPHDDPSRCAAVVGGNVETSQRIVDVLFGAFSLAAASQGTMNNLTFGNDTFGYYETIGGGAGATRTASGADAVHTHMTNTRLTDVEVIEQRFPIRLREFGIRDGSGGAGIHRGGHGLIREIECLEPLTVSVLTERRGSHRPYGLEGGSEGKAGLNRLLREGETEWEVLSGKASLSLRRGDRLRIETPGGGGYGADNATDLNGHRSSEEH